MGWGKPNMVHNVEEKMPNAILKDGMTRQSKSQTLELGPAQDLS